MDMNSWQDAGEQIKKLVQDAVDHQDFSQLGDTISTVLNDTVDGLQASLKQNLGYGRGSREKTDDSDFIYQSTNRKAADRIRREMHEKKAKKKNNASTQLIVPGEISGNVMKWTGYSVGGACGLAVGILGIISVGVGSTLPLIIPGGILAMVFAGGMIVGRNGAAKVQLAKRFRRYCSVLGDRTYCLVEELAAAVGQNSKTVRKDLKKMIGKGYFKEGYLDGKETMLITDKETYHQYLSAQTEYERRRAMEEEQSRASVQPGQAETDDGWEKLSDVSPSCREIVEEGQKYIRHIHQCNDRLPGTEISEKLDRLELVVTRIFCEVSKNPEYADDLKKMMSYYLPTTSKLLDAYCQLDAQPVRGQNIENTKREIESALDTINVAFENLLDGFFQDAAWDISSDITVLNTMLAQEGLTGGNDFRTSK